MDFIERWFGVSPDGGSGSLEFTMIIVVLVVLAAALLRIHFRLRRISNDRLSDQNGGRNPVGI
jgi:hypothetical protein